MRSLGYPDTLNGLKAGDRCTDGKRTGIVRYIGANAYTRMLYIEVVWGDGTITGDPWNTEAAARLRPVPPAVSEEGDA